MLVKSADCNRQSALRFMEVSFSYGSLGVLHKASFHVHQGDFAVLIGPNGSGKTTILRLLLGFASATRGQVEVLGCAPIEARRNIGYVPQHAEFDKMFPISVHEVVKMGLIGSIDRNKKSDSLAIDHALMQADVEELKHRSYTALSGGQRRRVLIARALVANPQLLVLDEPTANMDVESENRLYETLGRFKGIKTILMVTHDTSFVSSLADVILCVGERREQLGSTVVRHASIPAFSAPSGLYGGKAVQVLHNQNIPDEGDCCNCTHENEDSKS